MPSPIPPPLLAVLAAALVPALIAPSVEAAPLPPPAAHPVDFERDVRPILAASCLECHGPKKQKSDFRVDVKQSVFAGGVGGEPAVLPGRSADSPLIRFVAGLEEDMLMPPKGDPLTPEQIGVLRAWIDQGAVWPDHASAPIEDGRAWWSLQPLQRPAVPATPAGRVSPVDAFVQAKLAEKNLAPSPEADRRTLIRRAALTLTGLPPTVEETDAFVRDPDPHAYEKLVDRLLASPHFGERWAQHWLDIIRFAETNGSESNLYRQNAWPYRDYVVRAFNEDKPFDRFIQEQIAGDLLGVDEATGFLVAGMFVTPDTVGQEEAAIRQARADRLDETVQSVSTALLGLTMSCARCHNHKFDPIPQKDYYALSAVFQGLEYGHRPWQTLPGGDLRAAEATRIKREIRATRETLRTLAPVWTEEWPTHLVTHFPAVRTRALRLAFPAEANPFIDEIEIFGPETGDDNLALAARGATARSHKPVENRTRPVRNVIDGVADRYHDWRARDPGVEKGEAPWIEIELPAEALVDHLAISTDRDTLLTTDYLVNRPPPGPRGYRIEVRDAAGTWREVARQNTPAAGATKTAAGDATATAAPAATGVHLERLKQLAAELGATRTPPVFAGYFVTPGKAHLLGRGDPMDPREEVVPSALSVLRGDLGLRSESDHAVRRLAFARWLTDPAKNPLTPRVLANRLWLHVFGIGIVETPGDFGQAGGPPTHPELLDWLADEFVSRGWSAKHVVRLLVTSSAFRQSSAPRADFAALDAPARYLWRFPPRRVEAEILRDATLHVAGTLDPTMGGPGYRIHGDRKRFESWQVVDNAGPATWRRMIYQERMRGIDDRMFTTFDRPECGQVVPRRTVSTTPLQALNLLNGEFILTQAAKLAERITREAGTETTAQINRAFALVLGRTPSARELEAARPLVAQEGLPALGRALLNSNEFAFLE